jgi:hypothetical protein
MSQRTQFLSRLIGLYCLIASLAMFAHKQAFVDMEGILVQDPAILFIAGSFTLAVGLAIVLGHNLWSGGAAPIVITLFGWLTLAKGLFLFLSPNSPSRFWDSLHYQEFFYTYASFSFILGAYLTYAGFRPLREKPSLREPRIIAA